MLPKQYILELKNKVGALAQITAALAFNGVNILGISARDAADSTLVRMVVHDPVKTDRILREMGMEFSYESALIVPLLHEPGALHRFASLFAESEINITYLYIVMLDMSRLSVLFSVEPYDSAREILQKRAIEFVEV